MNEKEYSGSTGREIGIGTNKNIKKNFYLKKTILNKKNHALENTNPEDYNSNIIKAGKIARKVKDYAREIIKKDMPLLEIAEKIDSKITELGAKNAFPVNLSIDDIAAHYTPGHNDESKAKGLLKVDIGVQINGAIADTAFSLDLEGNEENKSLIKAAENALSSAIEVVKISKSSTQLTQIGKAIQTEIEKLNFSPIRNLCGHGLGLYEVHSRLTIPNYNNGNTAKLEKGAFAIEPFSTTGRGEVYEGKPSGIYQLIKRKAIRDMLAREIINYIEKEYKTLPFAQRWIVKKFGTRALISLRFMEKEGILKQYPQLIEKSHGIVAQAENTILITSDNIVEVTT